MTSFDPPLRRLLTPMRPPFVKGKTVRRGCFFSTARVKEHDWSEMIASALVSKRRRDCLHQTPIEAQPPQSGSAGWQARGLRNDSVPSCRPIHRVDSWTRRSRSVVRGLGEGQSSHLRSFVILM